jgi:hypothetical protein
MLGVLSSPLKRYVTQILQKYLGKYIQGIELDGGYALHMWGVPVRGVGEGAWGHTRQPFFPCSLFESLRGWCQPGESVVTVRP